MRYFVRKDKEAVAIADAAKPPEVRAEEALAKEALKPFQGAFPLPPYRAPPTPKQVAHRKYATALRHALHIWKASATKVPPYLSRKGVTFVDRLRHNFQFHTIDTLNKLRERLLQSPYADTDFANLFIEALENYTAEGGGKEAVLGESAAENDADIVEENVAEELNMSSLNESGITETGEGFDEVEFLAVMVKEEEDEEFYCA